MKANINSRKFSGETLHWKFNTSLSRPNAIDGRPEVLSTVLGSQIMIDDTHVDVLCGQGGGVVAGRDVSGLGESSR